MPNMELTYIG